MWLLVVSAIAIFNTVIVTVAIVSFVVIDRVVIFIIDVILFI